MWLRAISQLWYVKLVYVYDEIVIKGFCGFNLFLLWLQILYGLEYAHVIPCIREELMEELGLSKNESQLKFSVADVLCSFISPTKDPRESMEHPSGKPDSNDSLSSSSGNYRLGGLTWDLPEGNKIEDYLLFWIGSDNSAFANVVLTFNGCDVGIVQLYPWLFS